MPRTSWLDEDQKTVRVDDYARNMTTFVDAIADGQIDNAEIAAQEDRVVKLMKEIEPKLDDATHGRMTELLCELSAFSAMQILHAICQEYAARPKTQFQG
jgi:hypothetical protein